MIKNRRYINAAYEEEEIISKLNKLDREGRWGIVKYVEAFECEEKHCMVFERLGSSLYEVIKMNGYKGYPIHYVQKIARQVLETLGHLHENRLIHTDLKPENICFVDTKLVPIAKGRSDG